MAKITLENLAHSYDGKINAVEDINITFENKTTNAMLGPSGCGKTTLLKIITGLLSPTQGKVYFNDQDVTELPPEKRNVAIVFQFPVVYSMSVEENLMFPLINLKIPKEEKRRKVQDVAESLGLESIIKENAPRLGPADRQKVSIGRVLVREPSVFLFDEPLSSIEPEKRTGLKTQIKRIQEKLGQTTIYVTHDQTEALTFAKNVAIMDKGKIAQFDTVENIYANPNTVFVGFFIGSPGMNILEGHNKGDKIDLKDFSLKAPSGVKIPAAVTTMKIGVRPEHVEVRDKAKPAWHPFTVEAYEDLGKGFGILHITTNSHKIRARTTIPFSPGEKAWINFTPGRIHLFDDQGQRIPS